MDCTIDDVKRMVLGLGLRDMVVRISGDARLEDIEDALLRTQRKTYKPCLVLANKSDLEGDPGGSPP
jgi:ribosome-interacting GTPase 1